MIVRRTGAAAAWIAAALLFFPPGARTATVTADMPVFGTRVEITLYGVERARAARALEGLRTLFARMHREWHAWEESPVVRLNRRLAAGGWVPVPPDLRALIVASKRLYRASGGRFNPAIGRLVALWGFHRQDWTDARPPPPAAVRALLARHPGMDDVRVRGNAVRSRNPAVALDFGAIAKGYGLDRAVAVLRRMGIRNALLNAGGDLRAIGRHGGRPWRIGIRNPAGGVLATLEVDGDASVFTSGDYERGYTYRGRRYHHILDPRTGYPARGTRSVTVLFHGDAASADAAATALFVAGPRDWYRVARRMGAAGVLLIASDGTIHMNPAMARKVHFLQRQGAIALSAPLGRRAPGP